MRTMLGALIGLSLGCGALAAPACAEPVVRETIRGTIGPSFVHETAWDELGLFGAPSLDIDGAAFALSFVVDYNQAAQIGGCGFQEPCERGKAVSDAKLTINGKTWDFRNHGPGIGEVAALKFGEQDTPEGYSRFEISVVPDFTGVTGWDDLFNREFAATDGDGWFRYFDRTSGDDTDFYLTPTSIAYAPATVPEPATWAIMLMGLGAAGLILRRHREPGLRAPEAWRAGLRRDEPGQASA